MSSALEFHGATIELGPVCVASCAGCAASARPRLDAAAAQRLLGELVSIGDELALRSVGLVAPDALADLELVAGLARGLAVHGFEVRAATSGRSWPEVGRAGLARLRASGLAALAVRLAPGHPGPEAGQLDQLVTEARALGLGCDFLVDVERAADVPRELLATSAFNSGASVVVFDASRAARQPGADPRLLTLRGVPPCSPCRTRLRLQLLSTGAVFPCPQGVRSSALRLGDWLQEPLREIVRRAGDDPRLRALSGEGPRALLPRAGEPPPSGPYHDVCHACERLQGARA